MKTITVMKSGKALLLALAVGALAMAAASGLAEDKKAATQPVAPAASQPATQAAVEGGMEDLNTLLKLPVAAFRDTPTDIRVENLEPMRKGARPKFLVPAGVKNVALDKKVTSSDKEPVIGDLKCITDGTKEAVEGGYVELGPGTQWVQIDLGSEYKMYAFVLWHYHAAARVYKDVIIQVSNDADFIEKTTVFNNDHDNSSGMGVGKDLAYIEGYEGKIIDAKAVTGRYVRLYSKGSTASEFNHYTEMEVYALPAR